MLLGAGMGYSGLCKEGAAGHSAAACRLKLRLSCGAWHQLSPPPTFPPPCQGVCFGHQLVGCTLGARVGRAGCWEVGARRVAVAAQARERLVAEGAAWAALLPDSICLHEFHQDQARQGVY